jgi:hypothetical protein
MVTANLPLLLLLLNILPKALNMISRKIIQYPPNNKKINETWLNTF